MMRHSNETRRSSDKIEETRSGDTHRRSQDSFLRGLSDRSDSPKTPQDYLTQIENNSRYLTSDEQKAHLPRIQENVAALQEAERSRLDTPLLQAFWDTVTRNNPEKINQEVVSDFTFRLKLGKHGLPPIRP